MRKNFTLVSLHPFVLDWVFNESTAEKWGNSFKSGLHRYQWSNMDLCTNILNQNKPVIIDFSYNLGVVHAELSQFRVLLKNSTMNLVQMVQDDIMVFFHWSRPSTNTVCSLWSQWLCRWQSRATGSTVHLTNYWSQIPLQLILKPIIRSIITLHYMPFLLIKRAWEVGQAGAATWENWMFSSYLCSWRWRIQCRLSRWRRS